MTYIIQLIPKKGLPLGRGKVELPRPLQNRPAILLVGERAGDRQRAGHPGKERDRLLAALLVARGRNVLRHSPDVRSQRLQEPPARAARPASVFRCERRYRTSARDIVAVLDVEVRIDERLQLAAMRRVRYRLRHTVTNLLQALLECLRKQILFAVEVTIEAAMRQAEVPHQIADSCAFASAAAEPAGGRSDDSFTRLLFVFGAVSHDPTCNFRCYTSSHSVVSTAPRAHALARQNRKRRPSHSPGVVRLRLARLARRRAAPRRAHDPKRTLLCVFECFASSRLRPTAITRRAVV